MHKITCSSCRQLVEVSPSSAICAECGEDLVGLFPAVGTSQHYYARAELLIDQDDIDGALTVVKDGLETVISSDLLLLGAILGEKVGQYDLMRHYVSRIPVDDTLRIEGEWLLRAHQARQRAQRQGRDPSQAILEQMGGELGLPSDLGSDVERTQGAGTSSTAAGSTVADSTVAGPARQRDLVSTLALLLLVALIGLGWFYSDRLLSQSWVPAALRTDAPVEVLAPQSPATGSTGSGNTGTGNTNADSGAPATELSIDGSSTSGAASVPENSIDSQATLDDALPSETTDDASTDGADTDVVVVPTPTIDSDILLKQYNQDAPDNNSAEENQPNNSPTDNTPGNESVPDNVTDVATPEPLADASSQSIVEVVVQEPFDILKYLREFGRPDLANLPLDAQVVDDKVFVSGVVKWYEEREAVIEALSFAPGIADVNPIGLKIRTPETYTIQEADTLWIIAFRIYGDGARWPEIYELNQDVLISPDTLGLGQELKIPSR